MKLIVSDQLKSTSIDHVSTIKRAESKDPEALLEIARELVRIARLMDKDSKKAILYLDKGNVESARRCIDQYYDIIEKWNES